MEQAQDRLAFRRFFFRHGHRWRESSRAVRLTSLLFAFSASLVAAQDADESPTSLTGGWQARQKIEESGLTPFAFLSAEAWGNLKGGLEQKGWLNSLLDFGFELDTDALGLWEGGKFFAQGHWVENSRPTGSFDDYVGGFNPVSGITASHHIRVYNLYYQQDLRDDTLRLKFGQIAADDDFMLSDFSVLFLHSAFGAMPSQVGTPLATSDGGYAGFPIYSVAAPGVFIQLRPRESLYAQMAVYHGHPGPDAPDNYGFEWANRNHSELGLFLETGISYEVFKLSATTRFGVSYHTGEIDDFTATPGEERDVKEQMPGMYLIQDVTLMRDAEGEAKLGAFVRVGGTSKPSRSTVSLYVDGGLNWFAPLPSRKNDVAGLGVSHTKFGDDYAESTGAPGISKGETTVEATYRAAVTRWLSIQGDLQVLFNPEVNPESNTRETAIIVGARAVVEF